MKKKTKTYNIHINNFIEKMHDLIEIQECFHNDMEKNQQKLFGKGLNDLYRVNGESPNDKIKISSRLKKQTN